MSLGDYTPRQQMGYLTIAIGGSAAVISYGESQILGVIIAGLVIAILSYLIGAWWTASKMKEKKWHSEENYDEV